MFKGKFFSLFLALFSIWALFPAGSWAQYEGDSEKYDPSWFEKNPDYIVPPTRPASKPVPKPARALSGAILINGGYKPSINFYSHYLHLKWMTETLEKFGLSKENIAIFASDGNSPEPDLAVLKEKLKLEQWLFRFGIEHKFFPVVFSYIDTRLEGYRLFSAKKKVLKSYLYKLSPKLEANSPPLLVFVTDHGGKNRRVRHHRNNFIYLWGETLTVRKYHKFLRGIKSRVISVMAQCYSGSFAWSNFRRPGVFGIPDGSRCGFYSTLPHKLSYGCYPQYQRQRHIGYAYRMIRALSKAKSFDEAHKLVLLSDLTPDIPIRSSDAYLYFMLRRDARGEGIDPDTLVDQILKKYSGKGYPGIEEDRKLIGAIAERFGLPSPVNIEAVERQRALLKKKRHWWRRVQNMWREVFVTARDFHLHAIYHQKHQLRKAVRKLSRKPHKYFKKLYPKLPQNSINKNWYQLFFGGDERHSRAGSGLSGQRECAAGLLPPPAPPGKSKGKDKGGQVQELPPPKSKEAKRKLREFLKKIKLFELRKRREKGRRAPTASQEVADREALKTLAQLRDTFINYVGSRPKLLQRLWKIKLKMDEMEHYILKLGTKIAALDRIKILLYRMAGRLLLEHGQHPDFRAYRRGLNNLLACEGSPLPGSATFQGAQLEPFSVGEPSALPSWLGINFRPYHRHNHRGHRHREDETIPQGAVVVVNVFLNTPAQEAGLQPGDIITAVGGEILREPYEIRERVMFAPPGRPIPFSVIRGGQLRIIRVKLRRLHTPPLMKLPPLLGRTVNDLKPAREILTDRPLPALRRDRVYLLFFWATWCGPCKAALPSLRALQKKYSDRGLTIISISRESRKVLLNWLQKNGSRIPFLNAYDPSDTTLFDKFKIRGTPTFILISKNKISRIVVGFLPEKFKKFEKAIEKFFER